MGEVIIKAEKLGKKYLISHQRKWKRYWTFREVAMMETRRFFQRIGTTFKGNQPLTETETEEFWALKDIDFEVNRGDRVGVIGRNGAGKSTLLKVLSRITEPSLGRVVIKGRVASLLEVGTGFHPELTGTENIFLNGAILGMNRKEIRQKFDEIVEFAGVEQFLDTPVKRFSSGMYVRLAFAVAAHLESDILLVDEVLAVGDTEFQKKCLGKMEEVSKDQGRTVLFVSHNLGMILNLCNTGILLKNGGIVRQGSIETVTKTYLEREKETQLSFGKMLKNLRINQVGTEIHLTVDYDSDIPLDIPHLGFVVKNNMGAPVFGSNPSIDLIDFKTRHSHPNQGSIKAIIKQPKLLDGDYLLSVWFGDSKQNHLEAIDCLSFHIAGMTHQRQLSPNVVGNVLPECEWMFY